MSAWPGQKVPDDLLGRPNTNLNVIEFAKAGAQVKFMSFHEITAHGVEWLLAFVLPKLVERFNDRAVKKSRAEFRATILQRRNVRGGAELRVSFMGTFHQGQRLCFRKVQAMAQLNHGTQHGGRFDFAAASL